MPKRVLSVGQCGFDHGSISGFLRQHFDVTVDGIDDSATALERLRSGGVDLVLVNRVFDRNGDDGLSLIRDIQADESTANVPVMLVSNYPEYQTRAVALGAVSGFGKAELNVADLPDRLAPYLSIDS